MNQTQIKEENMIINVLKGAGISLLTTVILLIIFSLLFLKGYVFEKCLDTTILKFENKLQYNLPSGKKRGFAISLARKPLFSLGNVCSRENVFV